jgi:hypothetical protein
MEMYVPELIVHRAHKRDFSEFERNYNGVQWLHYQTANYVSSRTIANQQTVY